MPREVTTYLRLLNLCELHKADPFAVAGLMAVEAFATQDFQMLGFWSRIADMEKRRQAL